MIRVYQEQFIYSIHFDGDDEPEINDNSFHNDSYEDVYDNKLITESSPFHLIVLLNFHLV